MKKYDMTRDYCRLREVEFKYKGSSSTDPNPRVMVTSQNQYEIRGFNVNHLSKRTVKDILKEWKSVQNQPWATATKERVVLNRIGKRARKGFRSYKMGNVKSKISTF
jgi:hypothetical protein